MVDWIFNDLLRVKLACEGLRLSATKLRRVLGRRSTFGISEFRFGTRQSISKPSASIGTRDRRGMAELFDVLDEYDCLWMRGTEIEAR